MTLWNQYMVYKWDELYRMFTKQIGTPGDDVRVTSIFMFISHHSVISECLLYDDGLTPSI